MGNYFSMSGNQRVGDMMSILRLIEQCPPKGAIPDLPKWKPKTRNHNWRTYVENIYGEIKDGVYNPETMWVVLSPKSTW